MIQPQDSTLSSWVKDRTAILINNEKILPPVGRLSQTTPNQTTNSKDNSNDEDTDWKEAHKGIPADGVAKRKREGRCTCCTLTNHIWRKCRKEAVVASAFINCKGQDRSKPQFKPRTSTLAVPPPHPHPKPTPNVNHVRQLSPYSHMGIIRP